MQIKGKSQNVTVGPPRPGDLPAKLAAHELGLSPSWGVVKLCQLRKEGGGPPCRYWRGQYYYPQCFLAIWRFLRAERITTKPRRGGRPRKHSRKTQVSRSGRSPVADSRSAGRGVGSEMPGASGRSGGRRVESKRSVKE